MLLNSQDATPFGLPAALSGSNGFLCLGGTIGRHNRPGEVRVASAGGAVSLQIDMNSMPAGGTTIPIQVGQTWNFQLWHREPPQATAPSNLTGAITLSY